jgi:hypothetical protein
MAGRGVKSKIEIAEALYQAARSQSPAKSPESLTDLNVYTQKRFLLYADTVIAMFSNEPTAPPAERPEMPVVYPAELLDKLAEELAWKIRNPMSFSEGSRYALEDYAEEVGAGNVPAEVEQFLKTM